MNFLKHSFTSFVYHRIQLTLICCQCRRYFTERTMRLLTIFDVGSDVLCLHLPCILSDNFTDKFKTLAYCWVGSN